MIISRIRNLSMAVLALGMGSMLVGCDSSSSSSSKKAAFVDSPVIGISYKTATKEGTTDEDGKFTYKKGESVTFYIGGLELPAGIPVDGYITPAHLAGTADWEDDAVAKSIIRFLLTLDEDADPDNGIQIDEELAAEIEAWLEDQEEDFNFSLEYFDEMMEAAFDASGVVYVDEETAVAHFSATIEALGITITIVVNTESQECTTSNTSDIQGDYTATLAGAISGEVDVEVNGAEVTIDGDTFDSDICVYSQSEVTVIDQTIIVGNWTWTDGANVVLITDTDGLLNLTVTEGSNTGSGAMTGPLVSK